MAERFIYLVKQLLIFLIAGQTILHFGMGKQYERYVKLIISLMMVAQLMTGVFGLFSSTGDSSSFFDGAKRADTFLERWKEKTDSFEQQMEEKQIELEAKWKEREEALLLEAEEQQEYNQIIVEEIMIQ